MTAKVRSGQAADGRNGSIFQNCVRSRRADRQSAVKGEAIIGASEVRIARRTGLWQHEEAGVAARRSRPIADFPISN